MVLGELLAQHIEAVTGLKVERRFYLAGSYICNQSLIAGRIDSYVEYTGTALTAILKQPVDRGSATGAGYGAAALSTAVSRRGHGTARVSRTPLPW